MIKIVCAAIALLGLPRAAWGKDQCLTQIDHANEQVKRGQSHSALLTYFEALWCNPNMIEGQFSGRVDPFTPLGPEDKAWTKGATLAGRTILVYAVKGAGDSLQFSRFLKDLVRAGPRRIYFAVPRGLTKLMAGSFKDLSVVEVRELGEAPQLAQTSDLHAPLLSLPYLLSVTDVSDSPYLKVPGPVPPKLDPRMINVGIVFSGDPNHPHNADRSFTPRDLEPLAGFARVRFYTLQPGSEALVKQNRQGFTIGTELLEKIKDYADTAAAIRRLDAVISADTSVSHLAAALGTRTFVPLPFHPDLRYAGSGAKTEWYRQMVLLRQTKPGDWRGPMAELAKQLAQLAKAPIKTQTVNHE